MKKLILPSVFCLFFAVTSFAQFGQKGWKPFFPAQENMVGKICTGPSTSPLCTGPIISGDDLVTSQTTSELTIDQEKTLIIKFGQLFDLDHKNIKDIKATNVVVDTVSPLFLAKADRNTQFVYSALRADTVDITIKKDTKTKTNPQEIVDKLATALGAAYPGVPLDKIKEFLPEEIKTESHNTYVIKINNNKVYFMLQMAKIVIKDMKSLLGQENVRIFGTQNAGACDYIANSFVLNQAEPQTCALTVPVPNGGNQIKMVLESRDGKLFIVHNSVSKDNLISVEIKELNPGKWINSLGQLIYRYPFRDSIESCGNR